MLSFTYFSDASIFRIQCKTISRKNTWQQGEMCLHKIFMQSGWEYCAFDRHHVWFFSSLIVMILWFPTRAQQRYWIKKKIEKATHNCTLWAFVWDWHTLLRKSENLSNPFLIIVVYKHLRKYSNHHYTKVLRLNFNICISVYIFDYIQTYAKHKVEKKNTRLRFFLLFFNMISREQSYFIKTSHALFLIAYKCALHA